MRRTANVVGQPTPSQLREGNGEFVHGGDTKAEKLNPVFLIRKLIEGFAEDAG